MDSETAKAQGFFKYFLILAALICIIFTVQGVKLKHDDGTGYCVYARAYDSYRVNIYEHKVFGQDYRYAPFTIYFFKFWCLFAYPIAIIINLFLLFLIIFLINKKSHDAMYLYVLLLDSFNALFYNLSTGNIGMVEGLLLAVSIFFVYRKKYYCSVLFLGMIGWIKLMPVVYLLLVFLYDVKFKEKFKLFCYGVFIFLLPFILNILIDWHYMNSWLWQLTNTSLVDNMNFVNPSLWTITEHNLIVYLTFIFIGIGGFILLNFKGVDRVLFGILFIGLLIPEFKVYTYITMIIPIYLLTLNESYHIKRITIMLVCLLPIFCKILVVNFGSSLVYYQYMLLWMTTMMLIFIKKVFKY